MSKRELTWRSLFLVVFRGKKTKFVGENWMRMPVFRLKVQSHASILQFYLIHFNDTLTLVRLKVIQFKVPNPVARQFPANQFKPMSHLVMLCFYSKLVLFAWVYVICIHMYTCNMYIYITIVITLFFF